MMRPPRLRKRPARYPCEASNGRPNSTNFSFTNRFEHLLARHSTFELTTLIREAPLFRLLVNAWRYHFTDRRWTRSTLFPSTSADEAFEASPLPLLSCICSDICYTITLLLCCPTPPTRLFPAAFRSCRSLVGTGTTMDHHICQGHTRPGLSLDSPLLLVLERSHRETESSILRSIEKNKFWKGGWHRHSMAAQRTTMEL